MVSAGLAFLLTAGASLRRPSAFPGALHQDIKGMTMAARDLDFAREMSNLQKEVQVVGEALREGSFTAMTTPEQTQSLLEQYDSWIFDCDGVLWRGGELLPGTRETLNLLTALGKQVLFVTNNSSKSRQQYAAKFKGLGVEVRADQIVPSSYCAADYLSSEHPEVRKAFVIGSAGLQEELEEHGIEVVGGAAAVGSAQEGREEQQQEQSRGVFTEQQFIREAAALDASVDAVVCGWDLGFDFRKLSIGSLYLQQQKDDMEGPEGPRRLKIPKCLFVSTNDDDYDVLKGGNIPGNGCLVAALSTSVRRKPVVVGKPSRWLAQRLLTKYSLDPKRTVMVGDRVDTDVMLGKNGGMSTILVMTGCTSPEDLGAWPDKTQLPDFVLSNLGLMAQAPGSEL